MYILIKFANNLSSPIIDNVLAYLLTYLFTYLLSYIYIHSLNREWERPHQPFQRDLFIGRASPTTRSDWLTKRQARQIFNCLHKASARLVMPDAHRTPFRRWQRRNTRTYTSHYHPWSTLLERLSGRSLEWARIWVAFRGLRTGKDSVEPCQGRRRKEERERDVLFFSPSDQPVVQLLPIGRTVSLDCAISAGRQPSVSVDRCWIVESGSCLSLAMIYRGIDRDRDIN